MKQIVFTLIVLVFSTVISFSQNDYQLRQAMDFFRANKMQTGEWIKNLTEDDIEGSPYLNDEFINGTIFTNTRQQFVDVPLRYNIFNDDLEFRTPDNKVLAMAAPEIVERVEFADYLLTYSPFTNNKKVRHGFFKIVEEGKASLYARPQVFYKKPVEPGAYKEAEPAKFVPKADIYYIRVGKTAARQVSTRKEMIAAFPDHRDEIEAFIKKNKTKPNKEDKLIELVRYYNSL